ncbi:MAG TPA: translation initiation factor IF-5A [Candidatus Thermoplasmatota archaeon]|nr:translation initiation factor IF-5A [Candidatus Thermoplasmatota archaeon]
MSKEQVEARELKEGRFMLIDDEPCKIDSIEKSKPGKHGAAKLRIEARSIFTASKKTYLGSVSDKVWVPQVDRRVGQLLSFHGGVAQIMDRDTFETFDIQVPEEFSEGLEAGGDVSYIIAMERRMITKM